ncbi:GCN5 family acetyltransferase [Methylobacterium platani JCM 14648]|uniref:GCN5 family acetyltransferase n=2 Tax=Methylobacterium platani TaxID=427683 RepID=A0A179S8N8_9HYPH|nr:GCN5 family acetyltransferase [Methylobacterium platani JCM 14648]OAS23439.1 GCN5 family acetyltransferase [Methylobacterium platani]
MCLDGYTAVPPTHLATVVTYLERREPPPPRSRDPLPLAAIGADVARYRALYRAVGESWLWFGRARVSDDALAGILGDPDVEALALTEAGRDVGLLELDWRRPGEAELVYFGLVPEAVGQGRGQRLMEEALHHAFARPIGRLWVHTCTLDHPGAVAFYRRSGFRAYARAIEVTPDPRLTGDLPRDAAGQVPLLAE